MRATDLVGKVAKLQIHPDFVVRDERYDPSRLLETDRISVTSEGVLARSGDSWLVDVHHAAFPGRYAGRLRPVSVGFTPAYDRMRARFGRTARLGVAGENIIVAADQLPTIEDLRGGIHIKTSDGRSLHLVEASVANPCLEFTSYLLGLDHKASQDEVADDRDFLRHGMRGFIFEPVRADRPYEVGIGDEVFVGVEREATAHL